MPTRSKNSYCIHSVENALDVLEAICDNGDDIRISHLSEKLGMNKTSVFRLLATFESRGYVEKIDGSNKYRLGICAYEMGQKFLSRMNLLRKAKPIMEHLVRECSEAAYIALSKDDELLFLDMVDTPQQVKIVPLVGKRFPLSSSSAGRVILAHSVPAGSLQNPLSFSGDYENDLHLIHNFGASYDRGGLGEGITCVSVPLYRTANELPGSLSLVGPDFRMSSDRIEKELLPRLKEAGEIISAKLGYHTRYLG